MRTARVVAIGLTMVACSPTEQVATTTAPQETTTTLAATTTTTTAASKTSTTSPESTTTTPSIDIEIEAGDVSGSHRFEIEVGETFDIWVVSDVGDELHVHGYDLLFTLEPGIPTRVMFVADVPGIFEAELESSHHHLFEIEVSG